MPTITVESTLEAIMHLTPEQQDALFELVKKRRADSREDEWAEAAEITLAAYRRGEIPAQSAEEVIQELRRDLHGE